MTTPGTQSTDATSPNKAKSRIEVEVMIPGRGDPVEHATLCMEGGTITYAGARSSAPAIDRVGGEAVTEANTAMPGLWDCHVHFVGNVSANLEEIGTTNPITAAARAAADVTNTLMGGVTSVRDVGGLGLHMARGRTGTPGRPQHLRRWADLVHHRRARRHSRLPTGLRAFHQLRSQLWPAV